MTDIFNMDGDDDDDGVVESFRKFSLRDSIPSALNYRLLDEEYESPEESQNTVSELLPIPVRLLGRRNSTIALSYEIDIQELFVQLLLIVNKGNSNYKPKLTDFEPIKVLGQGSYGKVLLVREKSTGKLFAQKQLKKALLIINENSNEIHELNYQRTLNEKNILEMVSHPNIVKLYYAFQDHNKVYLILEYLDGGELFHHLAQERFMSEQASSYYIAQMILALRYLHLNLKVIYRDLKPENCMLNSAGNLVLTDFGLSKVSEETLRFKHSITGTVQYMAPEVIKGEEYDYSVDWWSLGCVAYDLLTGSPPFTGSNNKKIMDKIVLCRKTLKFPFYLSLDAKDFLRRLLQLNPSKRFPIDEDFDSLKKHRFFRFVDWQKLENIERHQHEMLPPILPIITDPILAENFDLEFTDMAFTPQTKSTLDILHVKGFSYINESYLLQRGD